MLFALAAILAAAGNPSVEEESAIIREIVAACRGREDVARAASAAMLAKKLDVALEKYTALAACAPNVSIVHRRIGYVWFEREKFAEAEKHYRRALTLEPTVTTNRLAVLTVLARQEKTLDAKRRAEMEALFAELKGYAGDRVDIWGNLAYVAFSLEDVPYLRLASNQAIALGANNWQAFFYGAIAEAVGDPPNFDLARQRFTRAEALGGPKKEIDSFRASMRPR
jgi:tetratricopeptide (TPR) repeat protein